MTRVVAPTLALALGLAAAFWVASCGGSNDAGLLPGDTASEILANLDTVEQLASSGDCSGAVDAAAAVQSQVDDLGPEVDPALKQKLVDGAAQLSQVASRCAIETQTTSETAATPTTTPTDTTSAPETTKSIPTETTQTTQTTPTQPAPTTPTQPAPTTPTTAPPPPAGGGGSPGGGGGGGGSSGSGGVGPAASVGTR